MGRFKDELDFRRKTPIAIFHKFRTKAHRDGVLYLFVEGYDDKLFYSKAAGQEGMPVDITICFGKKNLDEVFWLHSRDRFDGVRVLFIRDRDFDVYCGGLPEATGRFVTCGYSVENYVCHPDAIRDYFVSRVGVSCDEVDLEDQLSVYMAAIEKLHRSLIILYARIFSAIASGATIDLDKVDLTSTVEASFDVAADEKMLARSIDFGNSGLTSVQVNCAHLVRARKYLKIAAGDALRGKYLLSLAFKFVQKLFNHLLALHRDKRIGSFNRKVGARLSVEFIFDELVSTAVVPAAVRTALRSAIPATSSPAHPPPRVTGSPPPPPRPRQPW